MAPTISPAEIHEDTNDMENQVVEVIGRSRLIEMLFRAGLEVARPERDCGIDLIAYVDLQKDVQVLYRTSTPVESSVRRAIFNRKEVRKR